MKLFKYFTALLFALVLSACSASDDCPPVVVTPVVEQPIVSLPTPEPIVPPVVAPTPAVVCVDGKELVQGVCVEVVQVCPMGSLSCPPSPTPLPPNRVPPIIVDPNPVPVCVRDSNPLVLVNGMLTDNCGNKYGQVSG